jgi:hypothetical protein
MRTHGIIVTPDYKWSVSCAPTIGLRNPSAVYG